MFPTNREPPEESDYHHHLLIFRLMSFNTIGNKSYHDPEPSDMHRFHSCENDGAHHLVMLICTFQPVF